MIQKSQREIWIHLTNKKPAVHKVKKKKKSKRGENVFVICHTKNYFSTIQRVFIKSKRKKMSKGHKQLVCRKRRSKDQNVGGTTNLLITKRVKIKWDSNYLLCILPPWNSLKVIRQEIIAETKALNIRDH